MPKHFMPIHGKSCRYKYRFTQKDIADYILTQAFSRARRSMALHDCIS